MIVFTSFLILMLSIVFFLSGVFKLVDRISFLATLQALGISEKYRKPAVVAVPLLEIAAALLLLYDRTQTMGKLLIIPLLGMFLWAAIHAIRSRQMISCACFGRLSANEQLGTTTLIRIAVLLAATIIVLFQQPISIWMQAPLEDLVYGGVSSVSLIIISILAPKVWSALRSEQTKMEGK